MYHCQMPDCDYICEDLSQINFHHIIPRSMGGSDKKFNLIELCPNCHARIYVEGMTTGIHSIKHKNSIILSDKRLSTGGYVIGYKTIEDNELKYCLLK
jgi:5-methylcytosine-specific restriction endonuclease McrA